MHASQLAEIGSWVATHSSQLIYGTQNQPMLVSTNYWTSSKLRIQRWILALKMFERDLQNPNPGEHDYWPALQIVIQEILVSEMLTRVWSATVLAYDAHHKSDELFGLAHSVYLSHLEAKNRAVRLLLSGRAANEDAFERINALRRRMERWTDLFLGQLPHGESAAVFGFDRNRVKDFYAEQRAALGAEYQSRQKVLAASFSADLLRDLVPNSANPDLNREIVSGILACYPCDRFDSHGCPKSARLMMLEKSHHDAQCLIDELVRM
jgi:hypothetical protein